MHTNYNIDCRHIPFSSAVPRGWAFVTRAPPPPRIFFWLVLCSTHKLADYYVYLAKLKKMKVAHTAQVFSQRVGSIMKQFAEINKSL